MFDRHRKQASDSNFLMLDKDICKRLKTSYVLSLDRYSGKLNATFAARQGCVNFARGTPEFGVGSYTISDCRVYQAEGGPKPDLKYRAALVIELQTSNGFGTACARYASLTCMPQALKKPTQSEGLHVQHSPLWSMCLRAAVGTVAWYRGLGGRERAEDRDCRLGGWV